MRIAGYRYKITLRAAKPDLFVNLSHPDYNRRPRNYTGSADLELLKTETQALAGFHDDERVFHQCTLWFTAGGDLHPALRISKTTIAPKKRRGNASFVLLKART